MGRAVLLTGPERRRRWSLEDRAHTVGGFRARRDGFLKCKREFPRTFCC